MPKPCQNHPQEPNLANNICFLCTLVSNGYIICNIISLEEQLFENTTPLILQTNPHIIYTLAQLKESLYIHALSNCAPLFQVELYEVRTERGLVLNDDGYVVNSGIYVATFRRGVC